MGDKEWLSVSFSFSDSALSVDRNLIDCIRANAFREVMEEVPDVGKGIDASWVAQRISRSEDWVQGNWRRGYSFCLGDQRPLRQLGTAANHTGALNNRAVRGTSMLIPRIGCLKERTPN